MAKTFAKLAIPSIITGFLSFLCNVTMVFFAAHMPDSINVAVVGLASSMCAVMMLSLLIGINTAQETLTSAAFGAGNLRQCGLYLNRGALIMSTLFLPLAVVPAIFAEPILLACG